ncbi:MAG: hypothetical protein GF375_03890, partial [Candidatus Omnitrophica bacterium]|nr:hypothetical protein [Candidatus Omnitrophota bacterium]MBD3269199.1 hypothetical protein [Candidatus Omnitrophota bacterium]
MVKVINYSMSDNFIEKLTDLLCEDFLSRGKNLSKVACVFGGRRPALFLKKELSKRVSDPFFPPMIFSREEFFT